MEAGLGGAEATPAVVISVPREDRGESEAEEVTPTAINSSEAAGMMERPPTATGGKGEGSGEEDNPFWPDETAEVAFLSDAKERGETPMPMLATALTEVADEVSDRAALPPLDEMVKRIPSEVRDTLDELFRAKFVTVKRLPKKAFKS